MLTPLTFTVADELAFVHSVPFTIVAAWAFAVIPVAANNAVANIVASDFFIMFFPLFSFVLRYSNAVGDYLLTLYPAGHFMPVTALLFPFLTQTIFLMAATSEPVTMID